MKAARLWAVWMLAVTLGGLAGGTDLAVRHLYERAEGRRVLLLPEGPLSEEKRQEALKRLTALPECAGARWLSPAELAQEAAALLERERWPEIFPEDSEWLPWVMEMTLRNPFRDPRPVRDRVRSLKAAPEWRMAVWDGQAYERDRAALTRLLALAGSGGLLLLVMGMQGVRLAPAHTAPGAAAFAAHLAPPLLMLGALAGLAWALGVGIDARAAWSAGLSVLILAGLLPLVLKGP